MNLNAVRRMIEVCFWADVTPEIQGHRGIGKTEVLRQIGNEWEDPFTDRKGIPVIALYLATQEVTDLIGFPIKIWERSGTPVIEGVASSDGPKDRIVMSWAEPCWWPKINPEIAAQDKEMYEKMKKDGASEDELWLFWNRPKYIVFLDEAKRAQRDVMQAMYPLVLDKQLHMNILPRGGRIVTADNFAGAYDVREPDEAFMSRFCHIDVEAEISSWHSWAMGHEVFPKVVSFLTSNPTYLINVPKDHEDSAVKYHPLPDPRSWAMVSRVEKYGHYGIRKASPEVQQNVIKQVIAGIIGLAAASAYGAFADTTISFEDTLTGTASIKEALERCKDASECNKLGEKMLVESTNVMKNRAFSIKEGENLKKFLLELGQKDRATAILQTIFMLKNNGECDQKWVDVLMKGKEITHLIEYLMKQKSVQR